MYINETKWYKKQQRQRLKAGRVRKIGAMFVLLFFAFCCLGVIQVLAKDMQEEEIHMDTKRLVYATVQPIPLVSEKPVEEGMVTGQECAVEECVDSEIILDEQPAVLGADRKYLIVIDAGHGGEDEGCSYNAVEEKDINLHLALSLKSKLEEMDFQVLLTRTDDSQLELEERVKIADEARADAFISIHQNSCQDKSAAGIETYYYPTPEGDNERLAKLVQQYAILYTKVRDRGIREVDNLYVIRESNMPSCLVETGFLSNPEEQVNLQDEAYLEKIAQGLADAIQLYFYPKVMYLTFDDGPVAGNTAAVLDILKKKNIKATFFVVGKNVERNPELAKRIVEEGHTIGIHCYSHNYDEIYANVDSYLEDFEKAKQVVYEVTGVEAKLFRFPGGSINSYNKAVYEDIIVEMTNKGYMYFDWNASFEDAVRNVTTEKIMQNAKKSTLGRKRIVMLAHDIVDETVNCLEEVIGLFPEYEMRALEENVEAVRF